MNSAQISASNAEPPGRKNSSVVSGLLRDAQETVRICQEYEIPLGDLPHKPRIAEIQGEATLSVSKLVGTDDGGAFELHFSFNGKALVEKQSLQKKGTPSVQIYEADLQHIVDSMPQDTSKMYVLTMAQKILSELHTAVLHARPSQMS